MKRRTVFVAVTSFCLISALSVAAQQQKESPHSIGPRWTAKILKASRPDSVTIRKPKEVETPPPNERNESPGENRQWLLLNVELTAPPESVMNTEEISLVDDGSDRYAALGRDWGHDIFVLFAETPAGLAIGRGLGEVILFGGSPYTGKTTLITKSGRPSEVSLLFRIPITTQPLYFQIGKGVKVPVPLQ